ncbi:MAG: PEP-CTERM sorting domain-containing protein [bacterium]|nr:PEP-CTERM sorting domain-containing protein [bacterium]
MRFLVSGLLAFLLCTPAWGLTLSYSATNNSTCGTGDSNHSVSTSGAYNPASSACSETGALGDDNWARLSNGGTAIDTTTGPTGSVSNTFNIDAAVTVDAWIGGNEYQELNVSYQITFNVDTNNAGDTWDLILDHSAAGLLGLHGDGTASAVGTQDNGHAHISAIVLGGDVAAVLGADQAFNDNPSNNGSSSQVISSSASGLTVASGTGDSLVTVNLDFTIDAFSNDGCSGTICSSASGGEEAAVLFGLDDIGSGVADADDYGTWGRSVGPDGYDSTWTLNAVIPEPSTLLLIGTGLAGLLLASRRK